MSLVGCGGTVTVYDGPGTSEGTPSTSSGASCDPNADPRCPDPDPDPDPDVEYRAWSTGTWVTATPGADHTLAVRRYDRTDGTCLCLHLEGPASESFIVSPELLSAPAGWTAFAVGLSTTTDEDTCLSRHTLDAPQSTVGFEGAIDWDFSPAPPASGDAVWFDLDVQVAADDGTLVFDRTVVGRTEVVATPPE